MRTRESLEALAAELEIDMRQLDRIRAHNRRAWARIQGGARDYLDWGALALTLHNSYGILENYFLRISKLFENNLDPERWHKALVEKMAIEIPALRPALLGDDRLRDQAIELLKFRHRVRNLYGQELDPVRTEAIQALAMDFFPSFEAAHRQFLEKLRLIAEAMR
jgi:hypothetical protein